jgi:hypothetical protein
MSTAPPQPAGSRRTLPASRRLDWRFLLRDPSLERVAYIGPRSGALLDAVRAFSREVEPIGRGSLADAAHRSRYDLLVVEQASVGLVRQAGPVVKPGGSIYAECDRLSVAHLPAALQPASFYRRAARAAGFSDVRVHWHWPTFATCTRIVPLDEPTVLAYLLVRGRSGAAARARTAAARLLVGSGLLGSTVPCFSIVGYRRP